MSEQFGHYVLETMIGRGGMGEVYRAYDTKRDRIVALKRLPKDLASDEIFQARFRRECRLVARLNEPHVIPIHDFGEINGHLFLDMRLVEGLDLSSVITDEGPMEPRLAVDIIGQVAAALQSAHNSGLIHRDIKPSNVLVTGMTADRQSVFAYLVDFGIARSEGAGGGTALTATTGTVGTLGYMAPERISGGDGDSRSDLYSLACVLYECLTGHSPFKGETFQVMYAHVNSPPPLPSAEVANVPRALDDVIRKGLAKDPKDRFQTASQFAAAARAALAASGVAPPPPPQGSPRPGPPPPSLAPPSGPPVQRGPSGPQSGPPSTPQNNPQGFQGPPMTRPPGQPPAPAAAPPFGSQPSGPQASGPRHAGPLSGPQSGPQSGPMSGPMSGPRSGPRSGPGGAPPGAPPRPPQNAGSGPFAPGNAPQAPGAGYPQGTGAFARQGPVSGPQNPSGPPSFGGSTPNRPPTGPGPSGPGGFFSNRKNLIPISIAAIVVIIAVIIIIVVSSGNDDSSSAERSSVASPTASVSGSASGSASTSASGSDTVTASPGWSKYAQFTDLLGTHPNDTANAYKGATCTLAAPDTTVPGMVDQINCKDLTGTKLEINVGRFATAADVTNYGTKLVDDSKYSKQYWTIQQMRRGLLYKSPSTVSFADVTSTICAIPTFVVQLYAPAGSGLTTDAVFNQFWTGAPFPNDRPAVCTT